MRAKSTAANTVRVHPLGALIIGALPILIACFVISVSQAHAVDTCANAEFRTGHAANLPDCRAYEQVTPVEKDGQHGVFVDEAQNDYVAFVQAADDGSRAAYWSFGGYSNSPAADPFHMSTRAGTDWSTEGIVPQQSESTYIQCIPRYEAFSPDLSHGVLHDQDDPAVIDFWMHCGADDPPLVPGQVEGGGNLFLRNNAAGAYQLITPPPVSGELSRSFFRGADPDLSHIVFQAAQWSLTPDAPFGSLYKWSADTGAVGYVSQVPSSGTTCSGSNCVPADGINHLGNGDKHAAHAVSADGSRVFFTNSLRGLFMREGNTTTQIDAPQGGPGPSGGGIYQTATVDGSAVIFTDANRLTPDASSAGADLYSFDTGTGALTNLTPGIDPAGAHVQGVLGSSEDGSHVYFVATGVLASNQNTIGDTAVEGEPNLYEVQGSDITFIATLADSDQGNWGEGQTFELWPSRVSPSGTKLAFQSVRSLTGYDNTLAGGVEPAAEAYLYDSDEDELRCVSCNPSGERPLGESRLTGIRGAANALGLSSDFTRPRTLTDDGSRLFFESYDALVSSDTNGKSDVYMYEWETGAVSLISTGRGSRNSYFADASSSGDDVFFVTTQQLVGQDTDGLVDLYDARVGGGLATQNPPPPEPPCSGDGCREGVSTPPDEEANGSAAFRGPGNPKASERCPRASQKTKRLARKVKKAKRKLRQANGKRAKRQARRKLKQAKRRHKQAKRRTARCERGDR